MILTNQCKDESDPAQFDPIGQIPGSQGQSGIAQRKECANEK